LNLSSFIFIFCYAQDIEPTPPSKEVQYYKAGPKPVLGFDAPTLSVFMNIPVAPFTAALGREGKRKTLGDISVARRKRSKKAKPTP
jgi:hypothetical protein